MQIHIQIQSCHNPYNKDPEDRKQRSRPHLHHHLQYNRTCHHTSSKIQLFDHCYIGIQIQMDMNNHIHIQMQIHNHIQIHMQIHNHIHIQMQIHNHIHTQMQIHNHIHTQMQIHNHIQMQSSPDNPYNHT